MGREGSAGGGKGTIWFQLHRQRKGNELKKKQKVLEEGRKKNFLSLGGKGKKK